MDTADYQSAQAIPVDLPEGWGLIAHYKVPIATILEFRRGGWWGQKITVMGPTFEEALRQGCDRMRWYDECYRK